MKQLILFLFAVVLFPSCKKDNVKIEPKEMIIKAITLEKYPSARVDGSGWDAFDGPDIYLTFDRGENANANSSITGVNANIALNQSVHFALTNPILVNDLDQRYVLGIFDSDGLGYQEYIGGIAFTPSSKKENLPNTVTLDVGSMTMTLNVTWTI